MYLINKAYNIYCREGITPETPKGTYWRHVPGTLKYVSCGIHGCWGVNRDDHIWFMADVSSKNCAGKNDWEQIDGSLSMLEVYIFQVLSRGITVCLEKLCH